MEKDERFKHIATDPKFKYVPKRERKIKIDKRFQSMFKDKKFKTKYTVDKRGRPVNCTSTEDLKRYYELDTDESDNSSDSTSEENTIVGKFVRAPQISSENEKDVEDQTEKDYENEAESWKNADLPKRDLPINEKIKEKLKDMTIDYARGQGILLSDSSSCDESESDESESEDVDHGWGELDKDAERIDEITNRLAICNMDWDRIRAVDLMVLFNSFLPASGFIKVITIYPSDFGLQRMKEEEITGPIELVQTKTEEESDEETEEGPKYHMEKLRQYQLNRLKYYYGVMECNSPETANKIYTDCDGVEYESSATKIDLRFIPDDMEFENKPKEICDRIPDKYEPRFFTTSALQQAKVQLTWDETNPDRIEMSKKLSEGKIDEISETDLQAYLASSSGEESEKEENAEISAEDSESDVNPIEKYRALLQDIENTEKRKKDKDIEMEITWDLNMKEKSEKLVKKKLAEVEEKTPFQQYLDKNKEKRKTKRQERKMKLAENKNELEEEVDIPSGIDMNDPYFAEEFNSSEFKKTKKKIKKTDELHNIDNEQANAELELLLLNENEDNRKHFSLKKIQEIETEKSKKRKKKNLKESDTKQEDDFQINVKDDRFSALYSSHHFNVDPTDPHFRKTKAMDAIIDEKLKRRTTDDFSGGKKKPKLENKRDADLSVLVKSVKRKTKALKIKQ